MGHSFCGTRLYLPDIMRPVVTMMFLVCGIILVLPCTLASHLDHGPPSPRPSNVTSGLRLSVSERGLQYAASVVVDLLSKDMKGKKIPDQRGKAHMPVGKVDYKITGMHITSFTKPGFTLTVSPGKGLQATLTNAGLSVHGDWRYSYRYHFIHASDHGSFDVTVSRVNINTAISMGKSADGHPTISMASCSSNIGSVHVKFHGGASWLYNLFKHNIQNMLSKQLQTQLCASIKKYLNANANNALAKMKVKVPVHKTPLIIDYRLVTAPVFGRKDVQTNHKGEFFWGSVQSEAPFSPKKIKMPANVQQMMTMCLSDYVIDTLGYVLNKHGLLRHNLKNNDFKGKNKGFLNTTCSVGRKCIGLIIPQLGAKFPNSSVEILMQTTSAPTMHTKPGDVKGKLNGTVTFNVRQPNGKVVLAFSTQTVANVSLIGKISIKDNNRFVAQVKNISFHMTIMKSNVGKITNTFLNTVFGIANKFFIIPQMNKVGAQGFLLPALKSVQFANPRVYILQNTLCFGTDLKYVPNLSAI